MDNIVLYCLAIPVFLLISAFFSASETALTAISRARIYQLVMEGNKRALLVSKMRKDKEGLISTVLIGNNLANSAASALVTSLCMQLLNEGSLLIAIAIAATLVVLFAEIVPKTYAIHYAERVSLALAPMLSVAVIVLTPVNRAVHWAMKLALKGVGVDMSKQQNLVSATDVIRGTIELHHREGHMIKQDRDMLGSILDLNDVELRAVLVHRMHVDTLCADQPAEAIIAQAISTMHSRIPLWRGQPDNIVAILHVKDLIKSLNTKKTLTTEDIFAISHTPWFVPETTSLREQLLAFRFRKQHFVCVIDEYGAWVGIVTLEDILEEIVGNIDDEHDETSHGLVQKIEGGAYAVKGDAPIRDLNRQMDWNLPEEEATTLAGLVVSEAKTIPPRGFVLEAHGFRFTVIEKHATHLKRIRVEMLTRDNDKPEV